MNIAFFLTPKSQLAYLYDHYTLRQCLEKMRFHGYTALPVIDRQGHYVGTVTEGDLLWRLIIDDNQGGAGFIDIKSTESIYLRDLLRLDRTPPASITSTLEELVSKSLDQNFIPVIDDDDVFIGIVTRKSLISYFTKKLAEQKTDLEVQ